jgi:AraC-like DNA-binding protein
MRHNVSLVRQGLTTDYDPKRGVAVSTLAYEYSPDYRVSEHAHGADQLIYAVRGVMEVSVGQSYWLIPPTFAVWVPARTVHRIRMAGTVSMRTLYLRRGLLTKLPAECLVLHVSPLLRELVIEAVRIGNLRTRNHLHCALRDLLLSQLSNASSIPTRVTLPRDARALAVANAFLAGSAESPTLRVLCSRTGVSVRTIERIFQKDVGIDFESWKRQARLMKGAELLARGCAVKEVAYRVGYCQPSAFVAMFRRTLGTTPKAWADGL